jgi:hypothetical protein
MPYGGSATIPLASGLIDSDKFGHLILYFYFLSLGGGKPRPYTKRSLLIIYTSNVGAGLAPAQRQLREG